MWRLCCWFCWASAVHGRTICSSHQQKWSTVNHCSSQVNSSPPPHLTVQMSPACFPTAPPHQKTSSHTSILACNSILLHFQRPGFGIPRLSATVTFMWEDETFTTEIYTVATHDSWLLKTLVSPPQGHWTHCITNHSWRNRYPLWRACALSGACGEKCSQLGGVVLVHFIPTPTVTFNGVLVFHV